VNLRGPAPDIEVIVLCKNEAQTLGRSLTAILDQKVEGSFSVTVIDSGSTDGSTAIVASLPVRLIEIPPADYHHARTRNLGAEHTTAPILVFTNGHTFPVDGSWLAKLTAPLRDISRADLAGVYGRQLVGPDASPMERFMVSWFFGPDMRIQRAIPGQPLWREQTLFSTVNCALRRDLWLVRPFSDRVNVSEDQEWSRFWLGRGYAIAYEPQAAVIHSHNESLSQAFRRAYDAGVAAELSYLPSEPRAIKRFLMSNVRRLAEEAVFLVRTGSVGWLPYAAVYEASRTAGWALGRWRSPSLELTGAETGELRTDT
jgi:rhamnosyltransferase